MKLTIEQIAKLEAAGLSNIGAAIYENPEKIIENVAVAPGELEVRSTQFGPQLVIISDAGQRFVNLRRGVAPDKKSYDLVSFTATADREGETSDGRKWNVKKGQKKVFAM